MPTIRQAKVGEMIRRELAELLRKELRDPRLTMVTVTGVDVARDFTVAKVFVSVVGSAEEKQSALKALQGASGFLRGHLGRAMALRTVPNLVFRQDTGIDRGLRMYELLQEEGQAIEQNAQLAEASGANDEEDFDGEDFDEAQLEAGEIDETELNGNALNEDSDDKAHDDFFDVEAEMETGVATNNAGNERT
jgi:ribosome-binding factor A